jgi:DNA-binding CsgD family transcriptional regulator
MRNRLYSSYSAAAIRMLDHWRCGAGKVPPAVRIPPDARQCRLHLDWRSLCPLRHGAGLCPYCRAAERIFSPVEELVKSWRETGAIEQQEEQWRLTAKVTAMPVPDTVEEVLMARIDRLPEGAKSVLQMGAVMGRALLDEALMTARALEMRTLEECVSARLEQRPVATPTALDNLDDLSQREVEVFRLLATGKSNRDIAAALYISLSTVASHARHILTKTGCANRTEAAAYALRHGLTEH